MNAVDTHKPTSSQSSDVGSNVGSTVYLLDITERKKQDSALKDAHIQLERAYAETAAKVRELEQLHLELASKNQALEQLSQQDGLTKLCNRRTLDTLLAQEFERAERYHTPLSVMLCDIDNFKQINDTLSHAIGDDVLRQIAMIFSQHTRSQDIVARYGGEEFVIVFPETPLQAATAACDNLRHLVASYPWHTVHPDLQVTLSMGVTDKQKYIAHYEAMLQAADKQMYRAKTSGKNRVCFAGSDKGGSSHNKD
jgi:diguanylate cyclase (GGDEF)-like protein